MAGRIGAQKKGCRYNPNLRRINTISPDLDLVILRLYKTNEYVEAF
ncbi:hypothetical protein HMPREF9441_00218 [Paraprevotella clara YIT 11840]|uniref:Uncharacterized protein n=1 Tax=Paraprevotella clara YIT 11840 TaxID=762968 RepID=G5SLJ9_9BACT|nr:hypothetical protein HMPREF9441_00218 [Paraprevotella clara YIT 11840]